MTNKTKYETGRYEISNDEYHSSEGLSRSKLMTIRKSPYHYWYEHINPYFIKPEISEAMIFGSAFHTLIMEQDNFNNDYFVMEKIDRRTNAGKERYAIYQEENSHKTLLTCEIRHQLACMQTAFNQHPQARKFVEQGEIEQSFYWTDIDTGIQCKARPDIWHANMIVDLKTTDSAHYRDFQASTYKYGYHIQAAMLQEAFKYTIDKHIDSFVFIACEKKPPYAIAVYVMDESAIAHGLTEFKSMLRKYKECFDKNEWPSYETQFLTLPSYAKFEV